MAGTLFAYALGHRSAFHLEIAMSVSIAGTMSSPSGATYNFKNVTNAQFLQEVKDLRSQGALSADQSVLLTLDASGGDSVPINGQPSSTSQALSDTTARDFISIFQTQDNWMHGTPGSVGTSLMDSVLRTLQAYQGKSRHYVAAATSETYPQRLSPHRISSLPLQGKAKTWASHTSYRHCGTSGRNYPG